MLFMLATPQLLNDACISIDLYPLHDAEGTLKVLQEDWEVCLPALHRCLPCTDPQRFAGVVHLRARVAVFERVCGPF